MSDALERIAREVSLASPSNDRLRLEFGNACAQRVKHLLEEPAVVECLQALEQYLHGNTDHTTFASFVAAAAGLANQHQSSKSIDGCGHAAVSATYAVANALAGKPLQAAEYAAYSAGYGQGGYGAVAERESFEPEFSWQADCLASLAQRRESEAQPFLQADPRSAVRLSQTLGRTRHMRSLLLAFSTFLTIISFAGSSAGDPVAPEYSVREERSTFGSIAPLTLRDEIVSGSTLPINKRYAEFTADEKARLRSWYQGPFGADDEPPFPLEGLKPIDVLIAKVQAKLLVEGDLTIVASVGADGEVASIKVFGSPSPELSRVAAAIIYGTRFKPALCGNVACAMDFPFRYKFKVQ